MTKCPDDEMSNDEMSDDQMSDDQMFDDEMSVHAHPLPYILDLSLVMPCYAK